MMSGRLTKKVSAVMAGSLAALATATLTAAGPATAQAGQGPMPLS